MKKTLSFLFPLSLALLFCISCSKKVDLSMIEKVDKSQQERILITTDLEVDDMNGVILSLMYADQYDLAGIVWTAGMYHFSGDGGFTTLGEVTPHWRCNALHCAHTVKDPGELKEYRPVDPTWLGRIADCYEADYKLVSKNNPNYPTPDYIRSIMKVGNIQFEGDYRFDTEGSDWIVQCILDDDERPLYIQHWGGINTTVRALYSIYEKYHGTDQWDEILAKVVGKVRISGSGEDYCRADSKIDEMFPGLQDGRGGGSFFGYGSFFSSAYNMPERAAAPEIQPYLHAPFTVEAYKKNHGLLPEQIWLMGEGRAVYGEPFIYNYGLITYMDWSKSVDEGWGPESIRSYPRAEYKPYDWAFCQFGCGSYINIGLRPDVVNYNRNSSEGSHYTIVMWEELAARADWAICEPEDCNHAPVVTAAQLDFQASPGETVKLNGSAKDPDHDKLVAKWYVPTFSCTYKGEYAENLDVSSNGDWSAQLTVPSDAVAGDKIVVNLEVRDEAERPMTRFAQYVIEVK